MSTGPEQGRPPVADSASPIGSRKQSTNLRVVYAKVPEPIFKFGKAQSLLSGMDWDSFVAKLLSEARPIPGPASPLNYLGQEQAPAQ
jgi:hypothetical protein